MWICPNCHTENRDMAAACQNCGANRAAGRFGSAPAPQNAASPRVRAASTPPQPDTYRPAPVSYRPTEDREPPRPPRSALAVFGKIIGWALMILLPLALAAFAWRQYDAVSGAVVPLLLGNAAPQAAALAVYIALAVTAGLLCLLPGLWTLLLCRRPPRRDRH